MPNTQSRCPLLAPSASQTRNAIILLCLSCHDGSIAKVGMMKGQTVETLPVVGGTAPTLLGTRPGNSAGLL